MKKKLFSNIEDLLSEDVFFMGNITCGDILGKLTETAATVAEDVVKESDGDYSSLGEKLLTLAKSMVVKHRDYTPISRKLASLEFNSSCLDDILSAMSRVIRPLLRSLGDEVRKSDVVEELHALTPHLKWALCTYDELYEEENMSDGLCPPDFLFGSFRNGVHPRSLSRKKRVDENERTLYLYCPQVWDGMLLCGMQIGTSKYKNAWFRNTTHVKVVDIAYAISYLLMIETVWNNLLSEDLRKTVLFNEITACAGASYKYKEFHPSYRLKESFDLGELPTVGTLRNEPCILYTDFDVKSKKVQGMISYLERRGCKVSAFSSTQPFDLSTSPLLSELESCLTSKELQLLRIRSASKDYFGYKFYTDLKDFLDKKPLCGVPKIISEKQLFSYMVWDSRNNEFTQEDVAFMMEYFLNFYDEAQGPQPALPNFALTGGYNDPVGLLIKLFLALSKVMEKEVKYMEKEEEEKKAHARSFETKKNIPQKILKIMEESVLNERFGYIEYDEICDTEKIATINAQLLEFVDTYFPCEDIKNVSLRFRRLGNHNANGLYYPAYRCIAVELSHPESFIHEFGHMLDYSHGMVSNRLNSTKFDKVYSLYVKLLDKKLGDATLLGKWRSGGKKSKYSYYTEETEVFARSFEVYITAKLGIRNSITRNEEQYQENPYVYHLEDEEYMDAVKKFFEDLSFMKDVVENKENNDEANMVGVA